MRTFGLVLLGFDLGLWVVAMILAAVYTLRAA
jgi:hypothetical protein